MYFAFLKSAWLIYSLHQISRRLKNVWFSWQIWVKVEDMLTYDFHILPVTPTCFFLAENECYQVVSWKQSSFIKYLNIYAKSQKHWVQGLQAFAFCILQASFYDLIIIKMKMKTKKRLHRYDINRPRSRHGHSYNKYKRSLRMISVDLSSCKL